MTGPVQNNKTTALTNIGYKKIDGLALKTYKKFTIGILLQDRRRKKHRNKNLARALVRISKIIVPFTSIV